MKSREPKATVSPVQPTDKIDGKTKSSDSVKALGGSGVFLWDMVLIERTRLTAPDIPVNGEDHNKVLAATALRAFAPTDAVEAMIASQAVALHFASLECSRKAMISQQPSEMASRLRKDAANSARAMIEMCEALDRRRGKGSRQTVRVERVVVNEGGQAIVGPVTAGPSLPTSASVPRAIGEGDAPLQSLDMATATREGERT